MATKNPPGNNQSFTGINQSLIIRRIKILSFSINEIFFVPESKRPIKGEIDMQLAHNISQNLVFIKVKSFYQYADSPLSEMLTDIQVLNVFELSNLAKYKISEEIIKLPPDIITTLVELSISHTRALQADRLAGTQFQQNLMFPINAELLARHFFKMMFADQIFDTSTLSVKGKKHSPKKRIKQK